MGHRKRTLVVAGGSLAIAALLAGCSSTPTTTPTGPTAGSSAPATTPGSTGGAVSAADKQAVVDTYAAGVHASYQASVESATKLKDAVAALVASPTDATLAAAKDQWLTARDDYGVTEAFRFYDGPIDEPDNGPEGQINAWPMDEAYVDYVEGDADAGVINNPTQFPEITEAVLVEANEQGGETNISTGWHAIEFLLWGQDLDATGPGARPVTDYTTGANAERRKTYLTLLADLLVDDLTSVEEQWAPDGKGEYRAEFIKDPDTALSHIFRGIGALSVGELAGERMSVAYETKDQEDEHSCFSDNTDADVQNNARGIQMVYLAEYPGGVSGMSPSELVAQVAPDVDTKLKGELAESVALTKAFPTTFEQMIQGDDTADGRQAMDKAIKALQAQGDSIAAAAKALGLDVNFEI